MTNNCYEKHKEKEHEKNIKLFLKKKKTKGKKRPDKDIKILLTKKKTASIIVNVTRIIILRNNNKSKLSK